MEYKKIKLNGPAQNWLVLEVLSDDKGIRKVTKVGDFKEERFTLDGGRLIVRLQKCTHGLLIHRRDNINVPSMFPFALNLFDFERINKKSFEINAREQEILIIYQESTPMYVILFFGGLETIPSKNTVYMNLWALLKCSRAVKVGDEFFTVYNKAVYYTALKDIGIITDREHEAKDALMELARQ